MKKIQVFRDSDELHAVSGALVDYFTAGHFERDGLKVHCIIGYIDISDHTTTLTASVLVIPDQLLEDGTQISVETVNLFNTDLYEVESIYKGDLLYE
jgi:hypothetical protein